MLVHSMAIITILIMILRILFNMIRSQHKVYDTHLFLSEAGLFTLGCYRK